MFTGRPLRVATLKAQRYSCRTSRHMSATSFTRPVPMCVPENPRTSFHCAILSTYSADLIVMVTSLLALGGCDLENRKKGSRVELVKAIEALRGRVRVLAQAGRVAIPNTPVPILKLLDKFLTTVVTDES